MEWIKRLNNAIDYIESHIREEIDYAEAAKIACCSTYHFQRMFAYMAGVPLSEYIRRRRMSLAAADLQVAGKKIVDIALDFGYNSPTAFSRAFRSVHSIAPSDVKDDGVKIKAFPPISFKIIIKGAEEMNYKIETKEAFRIAGISQPLQKEIEKNFAIVPLMWQKAMEDGSIPKLASMMNAQPMGLLGVSVCNDEEAWKYFIAVATDVVDGGFEEYIIPASTWAIFSGSGTGQSIQDLERRIFEEWLPTSGYEYANAPDIEVYLNPDPQDTKYEVWIPVKKAE